MKENLMIIVSGAPAAGKTTLSKDLAERFNLPVINKDEIKELLFDTIGVRDEEWGLKLGGASFDITYLFAEKLLQTGKPFIVEGNFDNRYSTKSFLDIRKRYPYKVIQLYCYCEAHILYERFIDRNNSGERHIGHIRPIESFEEYNKNINNREFKLSIENSITIDIDTTDFNTVDFEEIYKIVEKSLALY
ncbi:deoxyadenosine/deoxycytidine kinase [Clostridium punense]|uniref:Deoxyadenosine/deoxycytidine kinase n=1 Tax=Clostridium punense TaxID=1054297 RepID=A0ABS4K6E8_9CLOT|nr:MULTISPECIES: AAA family ATPase [Clostridium]EQB90429.1 hypothetical protein M918_00255 [Clostridium sp. BL8]MBP2023357.1 deoxyadenosine/deoxycytidine kinase [Clostridium punense]